MACLFVLLTLSEGVKAQGELEEEDVSILSGTQGQEVFRRAFRALNDIPKQAEGPEWTELLDLKKAKERDLEYIAELIRLPEARPLCKSRDWDRLIAQRVWPESAEELPRFGIMYTCKSGSTYRLLSLIATQNEDGEWLYILLTRDSVHPASNPLD